MLVRSHVVGHGGVKTVISAASGGVKVAVMIWMIQQHQRAIQCSMHEVLGKRKVVVVVLTEYQY